MIAKLPKNPYVGKNVVDGPKSDAYYKAQDDMLKFFYRFLTEHWESSKNRQSSDSITIFAIRLNFQSSFMAHNIPPPSPNPVRNGK